MKKTASFFERVYTIVSKIPTGFVTTYGEVAKTLGTRDARRVGHALHANIDSLNIPCHRVVFSDGRLAPGYAFGGPDEQRKRLELEGVEFTASNTIDLQQYFYSLQ